MLTTDLILIDLNVDDLLCPSDLITDRFGSERFDVTGDLIDPSDLVFLGDLMETDLMQSDLLQ